MNPSEPTSNQEPKRWSVKRGEKVQGKFTDAEMDRLTKAGKLRPTDLVRRDDATEWISFEALMANAASPPLPPPVANPAPGQGMNIVVRDRPTAVASSRSKVPLIVGGVVGGVLALFVSFCLCCGVMGALSPIKSIDRDSLDALVDQPDSAVIKLLGKPAQVHPSGAGSVWSYHLIVRDPQTNTSTSTLGFIYIQNGYVDRITY